MEHESLTLTQYIKEARESGMSEKDIRVSLADAGWHHEAITDAFSSIPLPEVHISNEHARTVARVSPIKLSWFIYVILISVIVVLSFFVYHFWQNQIDLSKTNDAKVQQFFTQLARAEVSFTDSGSMVFPDEKQFITQKEAYITAKKSFAVADLRSMELTLFEDGVATRTLPVITKGKEGSWWETPTGNYTVLGKWPTAFSSIGKVWMPFSVRFYGNYLVHGWPHYPDGTPVPAGYSGGCIRLTNENAEIVFNFVDVGTPVLVLEDTVLQQFGTLTPHEGQTGVLPPVTAKSFLITDLSTGKIILEKEPEEKLPIASLTKLMTAVVAHETIYLGRSITVNSGMFASASEAFNPTLGGQYIGLDLLYPLLMQSSNDTAQVLARSGGEETFIQNMNIKANSLNMTNTTYADASGISPHNIATAVDLTKLLTYIYYKRSFIFDITKGVPFERIGFIELGGTIDITTLKNYNEFIDDPDLVGIKNGQTTVARETMASVWRMHSELLEVPVSIVVLGSDDREADTRALHEWLKENYTVTGF